MAKSEGTRNEKNKHTVWGTWEELLLACAVKRHGNKNWESVAMEIQKRSSSPHLFVTPQSCKEKYLYLRRRFMVDKDELENNLKVDDDDDDDKIPWLEELRKLRVVELKREVQRYDTSIVSLQLKVKRLKEEREQSLRQKETDVAKSDPERNPTHENKTGGDLQMDPSPQPADDQGDPIPDESRQIGAQEPDKKSESVKVIVEKSDPVTADSPGEKPAGESSCNGSSETIAKESIVPPAEKSAEAVPTQESAELWESVAESKGEGAKESSDVQSSTSLSRKNHHHHRQKVAASGSSSGEEPETDEVSPRNKSGKSQPLVRFLERIRSHKYGSVFERRLDCQETTKYKNLIRKHIDLEIVHSRLKGAQYSSCIPKFFRDMLLLVNNALVFFPKNSLEFVAAHELRQLVSKEMAVRLPKLSGTPTPLPCSIPKPDSEPSDSLLLKPKSTGPITTCRKRSSITVKASNSIGEKKAEQKAVDEKKPAILDCKQSDSPPPAMVIDEPSIIKKRKRDSSRSSRPISKSQNHNTSNNKNSTLNSNQDPSQSSKPNVTTKGKLPVVDDNPEPKAEKENDSKTDKEKEKKNNTTTVAKKRSVANFLNRMKRNSSSNGTLLETLKNPTENSNTGKEGKMTDQKKSGGRNDIRKEQSSRNNSSSRKQAQDSPGKRAVGRPSKRTNASSAQPPPTSSSKRTRERAEAEVVASRQQPKKRPRR